MADESLLFSLGKGTVHTKREAINTITHVRHSFKKTSGQNAVIVLQLEIEYIQFHEKE